MGVKSWVEQGTSEEMQDGVSHIGKNMQEKTEICLEVGCQIPMELGSQFAPSPWVFPPQLAVEVL